MYNKPSNTTKFVVFDGLLYINIPRLSHNGMENPRTTIKLVQTINPYQANTETSVWHARPFASTFYRPACSLTEH